MNALHMGNAFADLGKALLDFLMPWRFGEELTKLENEMMEIPKHHAIILEFKRME